jgi:hypothetical protein
MKRLVQLLLCTTTATCFAQTALNHDPESAIISTSDVALFWKAFDLWTARGAKPADLPAILQSEYLDKGSQGVRDFTPNRIINAAALAERILDEPDYYKRIRPYSEKVLALEPQIRAIYRTFKTKFPDAVFPPLYFVIGRRNSGGTTSPTAQILGAEMFGGSDARLPFAGIVPMVAHELIQYQQRTEESRATTLLGASLREGGADFIAEQIAGKHINEDVRAYGDAHEKELWTKFQADLKAENRHRNWLYNGGDKNSTGPPDLGYYMGYRICRAYYEQSSDKNHAFRTITEMLDPEAILRGSRYADRF